LMRIITGQEFPTSGEVRVFGAAPAENDAVLRRTIFVREEQPYPDIRVSHAIQVASWFYPNWSAELAGQLLADFDLPLNRRIRRRGGAGGSAGTGAGKGPGSCSPPPPCH